MENRTKLIMKEIALFLGIVMMTLQLQAQTFNTLKEINTTSTMGSISNNTLATVGDKVLFFSDDGINGQELWITDGTSAGTQRLTDILPGAFSGIGLSPQSAVGNGVFYFAASDASELWRSDGTEAGTYVLKNFGGTNRVSQMFFHNGNLFFVANDGLNGTEPWISDGTPGGTALLKDINPGSANSLSTTVSPYGFIAMGSNVYFAANNGANGRELWKTDGTTAGTTMVKDVNPGAGNSINNMKAAALNAKVYFAATNGSSGTELWATDGTDAGTYQVKDISTGTGSASPNNLITFNGALFFSASNSNNNTPGLWKTDGTDAGTVLVRDLAADGVALTVGFNNITNFFTIFGGKLIFTGGLATGQGIFTSDGTTIGTGLLKAVSATGEMVIYNGQLYFQGAGPESGNAPALYRTDGTANGTLPVYGEELLSRLTLLGSGYAVLNNKLFFIATDLVYGSEVWSTDGTNAGTNLLKDINLFKAGTPTVSQTISGSAFLNGWFYFSAGDEQHGTELWKTNGTSEGTQLVKDIFPGKRSSNVSQFCIVGNQVFFTANNGTTGNELWKTDGTEAGTQLVRDVNPGTANGAVGRLTASGSSYVYFLATHPDTGTEMWRSDGTEVGTTLVTDLTPGTGSGFSISNTHLTFQNKAYYINAITLKLYVADGAANTFTEYSTNIIAAYDMAVVGNSLFIGGRNASGQSVLWRSDNGAAPVQIKVVRNTDASSSMYQFANCNGKLYFNANDGTTGNEPWVSDGTEAGTFRLKDIQAGTGTSQPFSFTASGDKVFFQARSTGADAELWVTDGTEAGTYLVKDINPGVTGSNPNAFLAIPGGKVLFTANNGVNGIELWQSNGTEAGTTLLRDFNATGNGFNNVLLAFHFKDNHHLWPLNDGVLFFARSAEKGNQLYYGSLAPQNLYVNDNNTTGDTFTTVIGNDNNPGTAEAPLATIQKAVQLATEGSTIYVDAGSYVEQVTITKGITITGAGRSKTLVTLPETTAPAPGDFLERGTFQSSSGIGEVHIADLSATGRLSVGFETVTPVIIQGGGSVRNCNVQGGNQGIFFRVPSGIKTALAENNIINAEYIGVNFEGQAITASLLNNEIAVNNTGFSAGVFANGGSTFTATGNFISNYVTAGISGGSTTNINNNSFAGAGGLAIQAFGAANATCNWYGTVDAAIIASRVSAGVNFIPWLTNGTDAEPETIGFQPVAGACEGRPLFYVNDNSTTDDFFTTAVGDNTNPGTSTAPFATIQHAVNVAPAGSTIYVDAGSYVEQVTISKGLTITGAGRNKTLVAVPATTAPAPGDFPERGTFQTTAGVGDVHIADLSATGSLLGGLENVTPVIIQGGGSVRNCNVQGGNQGIFFRVPSGIRTALAENNIINAEFIGVNFEGQAITSSLLNNKISVNNTGFSAGVFANGGATFTANGNAISNYVTAGISGGSTTNINNNSFAGAGGLAIQAFGAANATCNWFGTANEAAIAAKISGNVSFTPWLLDGTDAAPETVGFQPVADACFGGREFYVNDNSTTGDVFTTAIGNNANPGTANAPFATIDHAYNMAPAGSRIYVDAGMYDFQGNPVFLSKPLTFLGANYQVSPNSEINPLQPNEGRNAESEVKGLLINLLSPDITLKGFTFDPGNASLVMLSNDALSVNDFGGFTFEKNILKITHTSNNIPQIAITGKFAATGQLPFTSGFTFTDNRFEKTNGSTGNTIQLNFVKNVIVNNNAFVVTGSTTRTQSAVSLGSNSGVVDSISFAHNLVDQANNVVFGNRIAHLAMRENLISNSGNQLFGSNNSFSGSTEIILANNKATATTGGAPFILYTRTGPAPNSLYNRFQLINNTLTGIPPVGVPQLFSNLILTVNNAVPNMNTLISGNKLTFSGDFSDVQSQFTRLITLRGNIGIADISFNELVQYNTGTMLPALENTLLPANPAITIGTDNGATAYMTGNAQINIYNNKIEGFKQGVAVYDVANNGRDAYVGYGNLPAGAILNVSNNSFAGDSISINNGEVGEQATATCNWYGTVDATIIATKVSANVNYSPWLTNGTDADPATTGFQPLPDVCNGTPVVATLISQTNVSCFGGNNGSADVSISGGVLPYTTAWSREGDAAFTQNGEDLIDAPAGNYTLLVTDAVGATATIQVSLQEPTQLAGLVSGTNVTCFGAANGTATIEVNGGVPPYTYLWSNGAETAGINGLAAGTYSVTVTDANGCTVGGSYTVIQPAAVNPAISVTNISCAGAANGQIALTGRGGVAPYMFSLDGIAYQESNVFANLTAGNYTGYVMDANGCAGTVNATVAEPLPLEVVLTSVTGTCTGTSNGAIDITVSGGTTRYSFAWTGPNAFTSTREDLTKVAAGMYTLVVTDANGCTATLAVEVIASPAIVITGIVSPVTCFSTLTGAIDVSVSGGSGSGYTFVWSGPNGYKASTEDVSGLRAGSYAVTVTDAGGCSGSQAYTVTQPASALSVTATKVDITACDALGSITATAAGGTAPYLYSFNGAALQSSNIFTDLPVGSYTVQATDANGCTTALISVSIVDNGADAFEPNNTVSAAVNINVGTAIRARLAATRGTDADWYRFTAAATGSYSLSWSHPSVLQSFDLYTLNRNKAVLVAPSSTSGNVKEYSNLAAGTVYLVQVSGTQSFVCYDLLVSSSAPLITAASQPHESSATAMKTAKPAPPSELSASVFPNPHSGNFTIEVQSPVSGMGSITLFDLSGRALAERKVLLQKGSNTVRFENLRPLSMVYRVIVDGKVVTGKVIGIN